MYVNINFFLHRNNVLDVTSQNSRCHRITLFGWELIPGSILHVHAFISVGESIDVMHKGTLIIKLRSSSKKYPRTYVLDQEDVNICWTPSKKGDRAKSESLFYVHIYLTHKFYINCSQNM